MYEGWDAVSMPIDEALRQRNLASASRLRWIFAALALVVPLTLLGLFRRQENRLRALADHGRASTAVVTEVVRRGGVVYTHYRYEVDGTVHTWNVGHKDAPYAPGESFAITYLPEAPSLSRPGAYTAARFDADDNRGVKLGIALVLFLGLAAGAVHCERTLRRLHRREPARRGPPPSPDVVGRVVAFVLVSALLAVNFDPKVRAVQRAAFGDAPLGVPAVYSVTAIQALLFLPFFWVFPHLVRIVMANIARGGSLSKGGIALAVARADGELRRSRAIVLAGFVYFVALVGAWIVFAAIRGV